MIVHPSVIAGMAFIYAVEYVYRFIRYRPHNFIYLGKALARSLLMGVYVWVWVSDPPSAIKFIWIRWSLVMLLGTDLFYIGQDHLMKKFIPWK